MRNISCDAWLRDSTTPKNFFFHVSGGRREGARDKPFPTSKPVPHPRLPSPPEACSTSIKTVYTTCLKHLWHDPKSYERRHDAHRAETKTVPAFPLPAPTEKNRKKPTKRCNFFIYRALTSLFLFTSRPDFCARRASTSHASTCVSPCLGSPAPSPSWLPSKSLDGPSALPLPSFVA